MELRQEVRRATEKYETDRHLLELLMAAREDPDHLVATPNRLLAALPDLKRLKDGLIDAQLQTSQLLGTMSPEHPRVRAALVAEQQIRDHLHHELDVAVRGLQAEVNLSKNQVSVLADGLAAAQNRMERLVSIRASYAALTTEVLRRTDNLTATQHDLTAAIARGAAAESTSLITRVDKPETGAFPTGPRRSLIVAAGAGGGLLIGWGLVFLTAVPITPRPTPPQATRDPARTIPRRARPKRPAMPSRVPAAPPADQHLTLTQALARVATDEAPQEQCVAGPV